MNGEQYSYSIDDFKKMTVWEGDTILATLENVTKEKAKRLFYDVVYEMRDVDLEKENGMDITNAYGAILVKERADGDKPKEIRFITPNYKNLFMLPNGGHILITDRNGKTTEHECTFLDPYHFLMDGWQTYHICQFAEAMQNRGSHVSPFPEKRVIWSNRDLEVNRDWHECWKEFCEINGVEYRSDDREQLEQDVYEHMIETNDEYLSDERMNLDKVVGDQILVIADMGLWYGRRMGYQTIDSGNLADCLYASKDCDYNEWYVDRNGEFCSTQSHHDGTHFITYRKWKQGATEEQRDDLLGDIYCGRATKEQIDALTDKLGKDIGEVYGWSFPDKRLPEKEKNKEAR